MYEKIYYVKRERPKPSKTLRFLRFIMLTTVFLFTINVFANTFFYSSIAKGSLFVSPLAKQIIQKTVSFINSRENSKNLEKIILGELGNQSASYGIVISSLQTGERYYLNENKIFDTASLYKLWVMAVVLRQINEGKIQKTDILSGDIALLNKEFNIASDSADLTEGKITLSVQNALEKMITISDNYSALLLINKVKIDSISRFLIENNFNDSRVGTLNDNPKTSSKDVASFFDKLYHDQIENESSSKEMIALLKKQQLNGKLPKQINENVVIAHKTGELGNVSHDAGIVYGAKSDYIIVILSSTSDTLEANNTISEISKNVYNYFEKAK